MEKILALLEKIKQLDSRYEAGSVVAWAENIDPLRLGELPQLTQSEDFQQLKEEYAEKLQDKSRVSKEEVILYLFLVALILWNVEQAHESEASKEEVRGKFIDILIGSKENRIFDLLGQLFDYFSAPKNTDVLERFRLPDAYFFELILNNISLALQSFTAAAPTIMTEFKSVVEQFTPTSNRKIDEQKLKSFKNEFNEYVFPVLSSGQGVGGLVCHTSNGAASAPSSLASARLPIDPPGSADKRPRVTVISGNNNYSDKSQRVALISSGNKNIVGVIGELAKQWRAQWKKTRSDRETSSKSLSWQTLANFRALTEWRWLKKYDPLCHLDGDDICRLIQLYGDTPLIQQLLLSYRSELLNKLTNDHVNQIWSHLGQHFQGEEYDWATLTWFYMGAGEGLRKKLSVENRTTLKNNWQQKINEFLRKDSGIIPQAPADLKLIMDYFLRDYSLRRGRPVPTADQLVRLIKADKEGVYLHKLLESGSVWRRSPIFNRLRALPDLLNRDLINHPEKILDVLSALLENYAASAEHSDARARIKYAIEQFVAPHGRWDWSAKDHLKHLCRWAKDLNDKGNPPTSLLKSRFARLANAINGLGEEEGHFMSMLQLTQPIFKNWCEQNRTLIGSMGSPRSYEVAVDTDSSDAEYVARQSHQQQGSVFSPAQPAATPSAQIITGQVSPDAPLGVIPVSHL